MTAIRILHVDDEPDIREVVEISLGLDPDFTVHGCNSGREALAVAAKWRPDIILLDVMMPELDGPATLAQLRQNAETAHFPVVFMTARTRARETDRFRSLGAVGVIPKPFDPMTLAVSLRKYVQPAPDPLAHLRAEFMLRAKRDAAALSEDRAVLRQGKRSPGTLDRIKQIAHALSGAGGIYGYAELSDVAAQLEDAVIAELGGQGSCDETDRALDGLILQAEQHGDSGGRTGLSSQRT
jgi:CheY-like chemotaxis protein/HPt (histidine-containing phosphotransfer) domain-containing protein